MESIDELFEAGDDDKFTWFVTEHLKKGASKQRGISDEEYVKLTRELWNSCATDKVYAIKFLVDPIVQPELLEEMPDEFAHAKEPFITLIARIGMQGELIDAPEGYERPFYPGVHLAHIVAGSPSGGVVPNPGKPTSYLIAFWMCLVLSLY